MSGPHTQDYVVGDVVVAPGCGVAHVTAIAQLPGCQPGTMAYKVEAVDTQMVMWVPVDRMGIENVRRPMSTELVERLLGVIASVTAPVKRATWHQRQRRYREKIISNEPESLAAVLGELADVKRSKPLSFSEKRLFEELRDQLLIEFRLVVGEVTANSRLAAALA